MGPRVVHGHSIKESSTFGPLAPRLSQRPSSAAYGLGPSVFTIPANRTATDRASVSQAVACRGAPPLPPMSLEACRCCLRKQEQLPSGGRGEANGWRRPGAHPPGGEFRHRSLFLDGIVREVSEDGWGGRRQDPLARAQVGLKRMRVTACESQNPP